MTAGVSILGGGGLVSVQASAASTGAVSVTVVHSSIHGCGAMGGSGGCFALGHSLHSPWPLRSALFESPFTSIELESTIMVGGYAGTIGGNAAAVGLHDGSVSVRVYNTSISQTYATAGGGSLALVQLPPVAKMESISANSRNIIVSRRPASPSAANLAEMISYIPGLKDVQRQELLTLQAARALLDSARLPVDSQKRGNISRISAAMPASGIPDIMALAKQVSTTAAVTLLGAAIKSAFVGLPPCIPGHVES